MWECSLPFQLHDKALMATAILDRLARQRRLQSAPILAGLKVMKGKGEETGELSVDCMVVEGAQTLEAPSKRVLMACPLYRSSICQRSRDGCLEDRLWNEVFLGGVLVLVMPI